MRFYWLRRGSLQKGILEFPNKTLAEFISVTDRHRVTNRHDLCRFVCYSVQSVRESSGPNCRFWQRKCSTEEIFRIKIGYAFFVTFFAQAKTVEQILRLSESNNIYIPLEYFRHNYLTTVNQNKRRTR